jgi:hypothetical protein
MESLLNERSSLSETRQGALLQRTVLRARSWLQKVAAIVPSYGYSSTCSEGQLEQLLDEAQVMIQTTTCRSPDLICSCEQEKVTEEVITGEGVLTIVFKCMLQNLPVFLDNDVSQINQLLAVHR